MTTSLEIIGTSNGAAVQDTPATTTTCELNSDFCVVLHIMFLIIFLFLFIATSKVTYYDTMPTSLNLRHPSAFSGQSVILQRYISSKKFKQASVKHCSRVAVFISLFQSPSNYRPISCCLSAAILGVHRIQCIWIWF